MRENGEIGLEFSIIVLRFPIGLVASIPQDQIGFSKLLMCFIVFYGVE